MAQSLLLLSIISTLATLAPADVGESITREIQAVKHPIDTTITNAASSQCTNIKKLFAVTYDQLKDENEPNVDELTLELRTKAFRVIYNITAAARLVPAHTDIDVKNKLVIFVHGFTDDPNGGGFTAISDAFLQHGDVTILALDGSPLIHWLYLRSSTYVRFMGEKLGEVLAAMVNRGVNPAHIHMIGHSLGSHISGFTGKTFNNLTGLNLGRISGLDPAGPCFSHVDPDLRLKETDAAFVDVIHTDAGVYGLKDPVGHVDFYPNEGAKQPNCLLQTCSHSRAWELYAESVTKPQAFPAAKCDSWEAFKEYNCTDISYMGYHSKRDRRGLYYLRTAGESPFGLGEKGLKYEGEKGAVNNAVAGGKRLGGNIPVIGQLFG